ncbi:hypothetical protein PYCCODRAFT_1528785 [Trametes coccinea BRFM310]|uniref:DNA glycosylase n=1 Tax=Trametes coccinea (strain BRFM310) TaxID=1353009 RepID=A0A1Y2I8B8_TRAC3|nr:hypothetical protein PYCCODRAFT_1528785 [Trametes coccinea BRFM310]
MHETTKRRRKSRSETLQSHYFQGDNGLESQDPESPKCSPSNEQRTQPSGPTKSRFFPAQHIALDELLATPAFACFYNDFVQALVDLYRAKPILIQEHVACDPWKVIVAVTLLNKTAGKQSIPVFFDIIDRWPTPDALAQAPLSLLHELVKDLGLGEVRSTRLIALSQMYVEDPPVPERLRPSRGKMRLPCSSEGGLTDVKYPPTPISHLPGCGPYALDSYRIFCTGDDQWKSVLPRDKELVKYLRWKWAFEEYRRWDPHRGPGDTIDLDYIRSMTAELNVAEISH